MYINILKLQFSKVFDIFQKNIFFPLERVWILEISILGNKFLIIFLLISIFFLSLDNENDVDHYGFPFF